jgi:hypothetical protein
MGVKSRCTVHLLAARAEELCQARLAPQPEGTSQLEPAQVMPRLRLADASQQRLTALVAAASLGLDVVELLWRAVKSRRGCGE